MKAVQIVPPYHWPALHRLIVEAFAGMEGRIDPPSSIHAMTPEDIARQAETGEIWVIGDPPIASIFLTAKGEALYVGKLAVAEEQRHRGHARTLMAKAEERARALGLKYLELQTRVELIENHEAFEALGFEQVGSTTHPGFDRPTSLTFRKVV